MTSRKPPLLTLCALFLLSLLQAAPLVQHDLLPSLDTTSVPPLLRTALPLLLFAIVAFITTAVRKPRSTYSPALAISLGLCLFVFPTCLLAVAISYLAPLLTAAITALTPVFCVILAPHLGPHPAPAASHLHLRNPGSYALTSSLLAFAGVLLIFPFALPATIPATLGLAASLAASISTAAGYCLLTRAATGRVSLLSNATIATLSAAIVLILASLVWERPSHLVRALAPSALPVFALELLLSLLSLVLLFWLAARLAPTRLATRPLWTLLLAVLLDSLLLQQPLTPPILFGLLLLTLGAAATLFAPAEASQAPTLSLR